MEPKRIPELTFEPSEVGYVCPDERKPPLKAHDRDAFLAYLRMMTNTKCPQQLAQSGLQGLLERKIPEIQKLGLSTNTIAAIASAKNQLSTIDLCLRSGWHIDGPYGTCGISPLIAATSFGEPTTVKYLLEHGANPNYAVDSKRFFPLLAACERGNDEIIDVLLGRGASPNGQQRTKVNKTCLAIAIEKNNSALTAKLLQYGADPNNGGTIPGYPPLILALRRNLVDIADMLLTHGARKIDILRPIIPFSSAPDAPLGKFMELNVNDKAIPMWEFLLSKNIVAIESKYTNGKTALMMAADQGSAALAKHLIAKRGASLTAVDASGRNVLLSAILSEDYDDPKAFCATIRTLIEAGADITVHDPVSRANPLHLVMQHKEREDIVSLLLERGANIQEEYFDGANLLSDCFSVAATRKSPSYINMLLTAYAARGLKPSTASLARAFIHAAIKNNIETMQRLVDAGADVNASIPWTTKWDKTSHTTALGMLIGLDKIENITTLIKNFGASPNCILRSNLTDISALLYALIQKKYAAAELLIKLGADTQQRLGKNGATALWYAAKEGAVDAVDFLLTHGANTVNLAHNQGETPLHAAASGDNEHHAATIIDKLLAAGANPLTQNNKGQTALHSACMKTSPNLAIIERLVSADISWATQDASGATAADYLTDKAIAGLKRRGITITKQPSRLQPLPKDSPEGSANTSFDQASIEQRPGSQDNALFQALYAGAHLATIKEAILRVPFDDVNYSGKNALFVAAEQQRADVVQALAIRGFSYGSNPAFFWSRIFTMKKLSKETIEALLQVTAYADTEGNTPLHYAIKQGAHGIARIIASAKPYLINMANNAHVSPLVCAVQEHADQIGKNLIDLGADIWARSEDGGTVLHEAARQNCCEIAQYIVEEAQRQTGTAAKYINIQDCDGNTALHIAALHNRETFVSMLLAGDADISIPNRMEQLAHELATNIKIAKHIRKQLKPLTAAMSHSAPLVEASSPTPLSPPVYHFGSLQEGRNLLEARGTDTATAASSDAKEIVEHSTDMLQFITIAKDALPHEKTLITISGALCLYDDIALQIATAASKGITVQILIEGQEETCLALVNKHLAAMPAAMSYIHTQQYKHATPQTIYVMLSSLNTILAGEMLKDGHIVPSLIHDRGTYDALMKKFMV